MYHKNGVDLIKATAFEVRHGGERYVALFNGEGYTLYREYGDGALCVIPGTRGEVQFRDEILHTLFQEVPALEHEATCYYHSDPQECNCGVLE